MPLGSPLLLCAVLASGPSQVDGKSAKSYAELLAKHVKNGRVDYQAIAEKDRSKLDAYLAAVARASVPSDKNAAIAMYIDAYNALVLKAVIDHKRPRSVLDVKGFFEAKTYEVAGKSVSLDQLEKKVINPLAKDPRTHMALVCGAVGCPILEERPYAGSDLNQRLDAAAARYLSGPTGALAADGELKLSKIFDWYKADFGGDGGVLAFVKKYLPAETLKKVGPSPKIAYLDYNWTLNQQ